jgi:hypothetical protein
VIEHFQLGEFFLVGSDDHLTANLMGDSFILAKGEELAIACHTVKSFQGTGTIIETGVNDTAIIASLMFSQGGFFF